MKIQHGRQFRDIAATTYLSVAVAVMVFIPTVAADDPVKPAPRNQDDRSPESRALAFLSREVPQWSPANKCFSCHNNGDGARALYTAMRLSHAVDATVLADTTQWLSQPERWKDNGGSPEFSDKQLATIQFAAALAAAIDAGAVKDRKPLTVAAEMVAGFQQPDGSWKIDADGTIGSPVTYGKFLVTAMARHVLRRADDRRFADRIAAADRWLRDEKPQTMLAAAAVLWALAKDDDESAKTQRQHCLSLLAKGQNESGGWGPYEISSPEAFDTAIVLITLCEIAEQPAVRRMIQRGRAYLIAAQLADGSWPETTRPAEAESYAQRMSTAGWATIALLTTKQHIAVRYGR
jgi:hypothetical protein